MTQKRSTPEITEAQARAYLEKHPELLTQLTLPERDLGGGIVDFQAFLVKNLQEGSKALKSRYELLVDFCRDNMSVQTQVHQAALKLMRTKTLEQLLEALTQDLLNLFDVDVVRLAMESDLEMEPEGGGDFSGIVLIAPGTIDAALGKKKNVLFVADARAGRPHGFDAIFSDCETLIRSCALLRLKLESVEYESVLAFGVRYPERFHPGQGMELLSFLASVVAYRLDEQLARLDV